MVTRRVLLDNLTEFVNEHRRCGQLVGDVTDPTPKGYDVWLHCPCGAEFHRAVTIQNVIANRFERNIPETMN